MEYEYCYKVSKIDEYFEPESALVLSFEGEKEICDKVYMEFEKLNDKYKIKKV